MQLYGIAGKARVGKDTVATYLMQHYGFIRSAFADPLKRAAQQMFGLSDEETWSEALKEVVIPYWGLSPRQMFQKLGTECGRQVFFDDIWLRRWKRFYNEFGDKCHIVVTDVRFENEAAMIREMGGSIVHVTSTRLSTLANAAQGHASEAGVPRVEGDFHLANDGTHQMLHEKLDDLWIRGFCEGQS